MQLQIAEIQKKTPSWIGTIQHKEAYSIYYGKVFCIFTGLAEATSLQFISLKSLLSPKTNSFLLP